jgi:hypothetical protein
MKNVWIFDKHEADSKWPFLKGLAKILCVFFQRLQNSLECQSVKEWLIVQVLSLTFCSSDKEDVGTEFDFCQIFVRSFGAAFFHRIPIVRMKM